jgi:hypothetical protein
MGLQCAALFGIFTDLHVHADETFHLLRPEVHWIRDVLVYAMLVSTALSGLQYLWRAALLVRSETHLSG